MISKFLPLFFCWENKKNNSIKEEEEKAWRRFFEVKPKTCVLNQRGDSQLHLIPEIWVQDVLSVTPGVTMRLLWFVHGAEKLVQPPLEPWGVGFPWASMWMNYIKPAHTGEGARAVWVCNEDVLWTERALILTCGRSWLFCRLRSSPAAMTPEWGRLLPGESSCSTADPD